MNKDTEMKIMTKFEEELILNRMGNRIAQVMAIEFIKRKIKLNEWSVWHDGSSRYWICRNPDKKLDLRTSTYAGTVTKTIIIHASLLVDERHPLV